MGRPLLLDGITIQLVGELLFDCGIERQERRCCHELYREALEEFAYAVVFGISLGRVGSLPERNGAFPGKRVVDHDASTLFKAENVLPMAAEPAESVLDYPADQEAIAAELRLLQLAFSPSGGDWLPYIRQEAMTYLPDEPELSKNPQPGARFLFRKKRETYFYHSKLQQEIPPEFTNALVKYLVELLPGRPCDDLPEFVERVLLTHYGISHWYEKSARAADFVRLPFTTRSCVRVVSIQHASSKGDLWRVLRKVQAVKATVLSETLTLAFAQLRTRRRELLYEELNKLRTPFEEHRKRLADVDFYSRPANFDEVKVNNALDLLDKLSYGHPTTSATLTHHWAMSNYLLSKFSHAPVFPQSAYHIFPELEPMPDERSINVNAGPSSRIVVSKTIHGAVHQDNYSETRRPAETDYDRRFAAMAIEEARKSIAEDKGPHPKVGAVVVKNGIVLSRAHRGESPKSHAEYIALEKKLPDDLIAGATVYTTLEPCTKRNHPKINCAQRLIDRKVARVVIGMLDPNPDILGRGDLRLSEAGIETQLFPRDLRAQVEEMNRDFIRSQKQKQGPSTAT